ncbi:hypothetical protein, partial [Lacticaseibacillus rhamnosus]|uniref:hypothetical protein n=1 Tax=Lacticaseibacillus rhamnosus TaxID=47715 RepID=UPI003F48D2F8
REAFGMVPPEKPAEQEKQPDETAAGPTSPGDPKGPDERGPESGGYDNRPPVPTPDNRKGGYGAG